MTDTITAATVSHIAQLARLGLNPDDLSTMQYELSKVVEFIDQLNAVDVKDLEPMTYPFGANLRLREDVVNEQSQHEPFLALAPETQSGLYLVPKVIE